MSSFRIGIDAVNLASQVRGEYNPPGSRFRGSQRGAEGGGEEPAALVQFTDRLTKWIPADTLALYLPGVTFLSKPAAWFLALMITATFALVVLGAFSTRRKIGKETWVAAGLAAGAFTIWSFSVPLSGWQQWSAIARNSGPVAVVAAVAALMFGLVADGLTERAAGAKG